MVKGSETDYASLDRPEILAGLFHPRGEYRSEARSGNSIDVLITLEPGISLGGRFHLSGKAAPNILFFHGNGEIVADYDDLGPLYANMGMNLLAVDYRGYGRSGGRPTVATMMEDCHAVFRFVKRWLSGNGYTGSITVMGRSLGSAPALELAGHHKDDMHGLIIESGFAYTGPLLSLLGIDMPAIGFREENGFRNLEKIKLWDGPALIIHAEFDHIIPFSDSLALYEACPSEDKKHLKIKNANHNDIFLRGLDDYMQAVKELSIE